MGLGLDKDFQPISSYTKLSVPLRSVLYTKAEYRDNPCTTSNQQKGNLD
jgi:hypothetical protein